jgi:predicted RNase H-like nuclease (RuvC/YqgF family)
MPSFFSKGFWVEDSKNESEKNETVAPPVFSTDKKQPPVFNSSASPASYSTEVATPVTTNTTSGVDIQKYRDHIKEVMRGANIAGPDYFELSEAMEKNAGLNLERNVAFVVAFNSLVSMGLTKEKAVSGAKHYIESLQNELTQFKADRETKRQQQVEGKAKEITALEQENTQLAEKLNLNAKKIEQLKSEKLSAEQFLASSSVTMENLIKEEISHIQNDMQTIEQVIK